MPAYQNVAIVGVGLIGGSIGLALRERGLAKRVIGVGRREQSLQKAIDCGAIEHATTDLEAGVSEAEVVIVATPVASVVADVCRAYEAAPANAVLTDVGSTKAEICSQISDALADDSRFVGSHPLAGDHRTGPEHARGDLLEQKVVVVTPSSSTDSAARQRVVGFWEAMGARVMEMTPTQHDEALAVTSHLPHLIASAVAEATPDEWLPLAATGWADTTRVAAGDPALWTQIFSQNRDDVVAALDQLIVRLQETRTALVSDDTEQIQQFLEKAKRTRDALGN